MNVNRKRLPVTYRTSVLQLRAVILEIEASSLIMLFQKISRNGLTLSLIEPVAF